MRESPEKKQSTQINRSGFEATDQNTALSFEMALTSRGLILPDEKHIANDINKTAEKMGLITAVAERSDPFKPDDFNLEVRHADLPSVALGISVLEGTYILELNLRPNITSKEADADGLRDLPSSAFIKSEQQPFLALNSQAQIDFGREGLLRIPPAHYAVYLGIARQLGLEADGHKAACIIENNQITKTGSIPVDFAAHQNIDTKDSHNLISIAQQNFAIFKQFGDLLNNSSEEKASVQAQAAQESANEDRRKHLKEVSAVTRAIREFGLSKETLKAARSKGDL
jgi:hypothetical protein